MANFNFNKVILGGRITADPELKQTQSGVAVCSFSVAVNRRYQKDAESQQTDFINVVAWRQQAEFVTRYFRKGSSICVVGTIQTRSWTDNQGQKRYATDVVADEINFVDSKGEGASNQGGNPYAAESYAPSFASQNQEAPKFEEISNDDDLPF
jgi:single-strand DNA-binding protein